MFSERALIERIKLFEEWNGPVDDPIKHAEFCIHMGRQSGKTMKLIEAIPADKNVIIISWNYAWGHEIKNMIGRLRPDINLKQIFIVSHSDKEMHDKIKSLVAINGNMNIYVDNAVYDIVALQYVKDLNKQYGKKNNDKK